MTTKIAIVVPNWNGQDFLKSCLDSLLLQSQQNTVIVVENGSTDKSREILKSYKDKIIVLEQSENHGFAGGVNQGIKYALNNGFEYIALFNNDALADKDWLKELLRAATKNKAGITTGKFLRTDKKTIDSTGDFMTTWGLPFPRGRNHKDEGQYDKEEPVFGASGGASLYSAKMFKKIGLFDEDFFAYSEDVDISFRAQLAGYKVFYTPKALAYHHIGGTSGKLSGFTIYHPTKNYWLLYFKNMPGILFWKYLPLASYLYLRMFIVKLLKGGALYFIKGWLKSLTLIPRKMKERRKIQKTRKASVQYIDSILVHHKPTRPPKYN